MFDCTHAALLLWLLTEWWIIPKKKFFFLPSVFFSFLVAFSILSLPFPKLSYTAYSDYTSQTDQRLLDFLLHRVGSQNSDLQLTDTV